MGQSDLLLLPGHLSSDWSREDVEQNTTSRGGKEGLLCLGQSPGHPGEDTGDPGDEDDQVVVHIEMVEERHRDHGTDITDKSLKEGY